MIAAEEDSSCEMEEGWDSSRDCLVPLMCRVGAGSGRRRSSICEPEEPTEGGKAPGADRSGHDRGYMPLVDLEDRRCTFPQHYFTIVAFVLLQTYTAYWV